MSRSFILRLTHNGEKTHLHITISQDEKILPTITATSMQGTWFLDADFSQWLKLGQEAKIMIVDFGKPINDACTPE